MGKLPQITLFILLGISVLSCQKALVPKKIFKPNITEIQNINDLTNNSYYPDFIVSPPLELLKEFRPSAATQQKLRINGNILFVPTRDGKIETYDLINTKKVGNVKLTKKIRTNVLPVQDKLIIAQEYGRKSLYLYDPFKGKKIWTAEIGSIKSPPKVVENKIVVATLYSGLLCLDLDSGEKIWEFKSNSQLHTSPIVNGSNVYQISEDGFLFSFDLESGDENWKEKIGGTGLVDPILISDKIICCSSEGNVKTFSLKGKLLWNYKTGSLLRRNPAATNKIVILADQLGKIHALNLKDGQLIWQHDEDIIIGTNPLLNNDYVILGTLDKRLIFLDINTGYTSWELELFGRVRTDPIPWRDQLIVGSENNNLYFLAKID